MFCFDQKIFLRQAGLEPELPAFEKNADPLDRTVLFYRTQNPDITGDC